VTDLERIEFNLTEATGMNVVRFLSAPEEIH